jgi:hypothetical protein
MRDGVTAGCLGDNQSGSRQPRFENPLGALLARDCRRSADDHPEPCGQLIHSWPTGGIKAQTAIHQAGQ